VRIFANKAYSNGLAMFVNKNGELSGCRSVGAPADQRIGNHLRSCVRTVAYSGVCGRSEATVKT